MPTSQFVMAVCGKIFYSNSVVINAKKCYMLTLKIFLLAPWWPFPTETETSLAIQGKGVPNMVWIFLNNLPLNKMKPLSTDNLCTRIVTTVNSHVCLGHKDCLYSWRIPKQQIRRLLYDDSQ